MLVLALSAGVTGLTAARPAHAARGMQVGLQDDDVFVSQSRFSRERALERASQLKVSWIRVNVIWSSVNYSQARHRNVPHRAAYDWSQIDGLIGAAAARGISVQLSLTGPAPAWASGNRHIGVYRPKSRYYAGFVRAAAKHFKGRVTRYAIWNEPNQKGWLTPQSSAPRIYRSLYTAGYKAIKAADPAAKVLIGETSPYATPGRGIAPIAFLRRMTCTDSGYRHARCGGLVADGFAHHPYDFKHAPTYRYPGADNATLATLPHLTQALSRLRRIHALRGPHGRGLGLYLTEYGYFGSGKFRVSESRQASYLKQGFAMAQRNPHVKEMLQYILVQPPRKYAFFDTSIVRANNKPRKAFRTLAAWARSAAAHGLISAP